MDDYGVEENARINWSFRSTVRQYSHLLYLIEYSSLFHSVLTVKLVVTDYQNRPSGVDANKFSFFFMCCQERCYRLRTSEPK